MALARKKKKNIQSAQLQTVVYHIGGATTNGNPRKVSEFQKFHR
jgi:hypothetical protein